MLISAGNFAKMPTKALDFSKRNKDNVQPIPSAAGQTDSSNDSHPSRAPFIALIADLDQQFVPRPQEAPKQDGDGLKW
eukprot:superscaffoldBa00002488_g14440